MKISDYLTQIIVMFVVIGMAIYPFILAQEKQQEYVEIYINNFKDIQPNKDFVLSYSVKNNKNSPIKLTSIFQRETMGRLDLSDIKIFSLGIGEEKTFFYKINKTTIPEKYSINILETSQKLHFWLIPDNYYEKRRSNPELWPDLPWEYQDPITQEYYRRLT